MSGENSTKNVVISMLAQLAVSVATAYLGSVVVMKVFAAYKADETDDTEGRKVLRKMGITDDLNEMEVKVAQQLIAPADVDVCFSDIGGLAEIKRGVREAIILPISRPDLFKNIKMAKGVLLYGPPGTGKTMLAKAVAKESGAAFLSVDISVVQSKWFGESQKLITAVFSLARKISPCIIFIDEIDCLIGNTRSVSSTHNDQLLSCLLTQWDGLNEESSATCQVSVLAASNSPKKISAALHRRLAQQFKVDLPTEMERVEILRKTLAPMVGSNPVPTFLAEVAKATLGYSGSDLAELCKAACVLPIREHLSLEDQLGSQAPSEPRPVQLNDFIQAKKVVRHASAHLV